MVIKSNNVNPMTPGLPALSVSVCYKHWVPGSLNLKHGGHQQTCTDNQPKSPTEEIKVHGLVSMLKLKELSGSIINTSLQQLTFLFKIMRLFQVDYSRHECGGLAVCTALKHGKQAP